MNDTTEPAPDGAAAPDESGGHRRPPLDLDPSSLDMEPSLLSMGPSPLGMGPSLLGMGPSPLGMGPSPLAVDEITALADAGQYLRAYEQTRAFGPLERWTWTAATMALAGRLARHLGAYRLGERLIAAAYRRDFTDPRAVNSYGYLVHQERGPYALWQWAQKQRLHPDATPAERAELVGFRVTAATELRDFARASTWLDEAYALAPENPDLVIWKAALLEQEDRYPDALRVAMDGLAAHPEQRALTQTCAHLLMLDGRRTEALDLLIEADKRFECASLSLQLMGLLMVQGRHEEAERSLDRVERLLPLRKESQRRSLVLARSDCAYRRGDFDLAYQLLEGLGPKPDADGEVRPDPDFEAYKERLRHPDRHRRVVLDVPFVRQHEMTCAPATLAALSRFWGRGDDHLEIASAICYDGTPDHRERAWAEQHGWIAREVRVTWALAIALIDRGVPFVLSTFGSTMGHAQAVIGYDVTRETLLLRDPFRYGDIEVASEGLLAQQAPTGPRGLVLVPVEKHALLDGIELPEADFYDRLHRLQCSLFEHDRGAAARELEILRELAPDHRLVHAARRALAVYDGDTAALHACSEERLRAHPEGLSAAVELVLTMRSTASRPARIERLETLVKQSADPIFLELLADELSADDREHDRARRLARRAVVRGRGRAEAHGLLGSLCWMRREVDEALELFRFAACLHDRDERVAQRYANAARAAGRADEALAFARQRAARHGDASHAPTLTLVRVLDLFDRSSEAVSVLEQAISRWPDDGTLLLSALPFLARGGQLERARVLLTHARGRTTPLAWFRAAAMLAAYDGTPEAQLAAWLDVVEREPLAEDAHAIVSGLLEILRGKDEARRHLASARERFPHSRPLGQLWISWLERDDAGAREVELRRHIELEPDDAWALRELALHLGALRRFDEAGKACDRARELAPRDPREPLVRGHLALLRGDLDEARTSFGRAFSLDADAGMAIANLLVLSATRDERDANVQSIARAVLADSVDGSGILHWYELARPLADVTRLDTLVDELRAARPELPATWSIAVRQHLSCERVAEAWSLAKQATERFPLSASAWSDLAQVAGARAHVDDEIDALRRAHQSEPFNVSCARSLALCCERTGRTSEARSVLDRMAAREPASVDIALLLASLEWASGEQKAALDRVRTLLRHKPASTDALQRFDEWSTELGDPDGAERLALENVAAMPTSPALRIGLARLLLSRSRFDHAGSQLDEALRHDAFSIDARDLKAIVLAAADRFDEATSTCLAGAAGGVVPTELLGRAAWVKAVSGDVPAAIAAMRDVVSNHPAFAWGWSKLAAWYESRHEHTAQVECCRELVRISPAMGAAHVALGTARLRLGDCDGARRSFERALTLANGDPAPAVELFTLQIEEGDLEGAERSMRLVRRHSIAVATSMEVELGIMLEDEERAFDAFHRIATLTSASAGLVMLARRRLIWAGFGARVQRDIERMCDEPSLSRALAASWARASILRQDGAVEHRLDELDAHSVGARAAAVEVLAFRASNPDSWRLIRWLIRRRSWLMRHVELWTAGTQALLEHKLAFLAAIWLTGCPVGQTDSAEVLAAVGRTLRRIGKPRRALAASRQATLRGGPATSYHATWLALEAAHGWQDARARELLEIASRHPLDSPESDITYLTQMILHLRSITGRERSMAFLEAQLDLNGACDRLAQTLGLTGRVIAMQARLRIASNVGIPPAYLWAIGTRVLWVAAIVLFLAYGWSEVPRVGVFLLVVIAFVWLLQRIWDASWPPGFTWPGRRASLAPNDVSHRTSTDDKSVENVATP